MCINFSYICDNRRLSVEYTNEYILYKCYYYAHPVISSFSFPFPPFFHISGSYELITFNNETSGSGDAQDVRRGAGLAAVFLTR